MPCPEPMTAGSMTRITSMPDVLLAHPYSELAHSRPGSRTGCSNESRKPIPLRTLEATHQQVGGNSPGGRFLRGHRAAGV